VRPESFNWEVIKTLKEGGQARILLVRDTNDPNALYVGKQALKPEYAAAIKREHDLLKKIVKPGFQHAVDEDETNSDGYISYRKFYEGSSLKDILDENPDFFNNDESEDDFLDIAFKLSMLIQYLHNECNVVHRDINPKNIILGESNYVALIDLGIFRYVGEPGNGEYTKGWSPPGQDLVGKISQTADDMYSLGKVFLFTLNLEEKKDGDLFKPKGDNIPLWLLKNRASQEFVDLCINCVQRDEKNRPRIDDLIKALRKAQVAGYRKQRVTDECPACGMPTLPGNPVCYNCLTPLIFEPPSGICAGCGREIPLSKLKHHYEQYHPDLGDVLEGTYAPVNGTRAVFHCELCHWATLDASLWEKHKNVCIPGDSSFSTDDLQLENDFEFEKVQYDHDNPRALFALSQAGFTFETLEVYRSLNIKPYDHQEDTAIRALRDLGGRCIIADGVGLGKTIECGIILRELLYREMVKSALIIVPNQELQGQWLAELEDKFQLGPDDPNGFHAWNNGDDLPEPGDRLIIDFNSLKSNSLKSSTKNEVTREFIENLGNSEIKDMEDLKVYHLFVNNYIKWDLIIVDEAHDLGIKHTGLYWKRVYDLDSQYIFLVTATPMKRSPTDLYPLIRAVNPGVAGDAKGFYKDYGLKTVTDENLHKLKSLLSQVMIRHTRNDVHSFNFPRRKATTDFAPITEDMSKIYDLIKKLNNSTLFPDDEADLRVNANKLFTRFNRSITDFVTWISHPEKRGEESSITDELDETIQKYHPATLDADYLKSNWHRLVDLCEKLDKKSIVDPKVEVLFIILNTHWNEEDGSLIEKQKPVNVNQRRGQKNPVLVFSGSNDTRDLYRKALEKKYHGNRVIEGFTSTMRGPDRRALLDRYNKGDIDVLVCGNSQSRGLNLQFGNVLINMDLPDSPVEIEQRIGRVERLEQKKSFVQIINVMYDTPEERFRWEMYKEHLMVFQEVLGDIDLVNLFVAADIVDEVSKLNLAIAENEKNHEEIEKKFSELHNKIKDTKKVQEKILIKENEEDII